MELLNNKRNLSGEKGKKKKKVSRRYRKKVVSVDIKAVTQQQREAKRKMHERVANAKAFIKKHKIALISSTASIVIVLALLVIIKPFQEKTIVADEELAATATPTPSATPTETPMVQQKIVIEAPDDGFDRSGFPSYSSVDLINSITKNKDTIGYISIDDTKVHYPVVQRNNNEYYLTHTFEKAIFKTGTIFLDCNCDVDDIQKGGNYVIYGHKMMNGKMFSDLFNYKKKKYFNEHKIVKFETLKGPMEWEIFSVFAVDASVNYIKTDFRTEESYAMFLETCKNRSIYDTGVTPKKDDSIITLSTCSYEARNYRLVVQARLIKPEDTEEAVETVETEKTIETSSKDNKETKEIKQ